MGLETGSFIEDLVPSNPTSIDPISQGDDHINLVKTCLQGSFPNTQGAWNINQRIAADGYDAKNATIINVANGVNTNDAVNVGQLAFGQGEYGAIQGSNGAVLASYGAINSVLRTGTGTYRIDFTNGVTSDRQVLVANAFGDHTFAAQHVCMVEPETAQRVWVIIENSNNALVDLNFYFHRFYW